MVNTVALADTTIKSIVKNTPVNLKQYGNPNAPVPKIPLIKFTVAWFTEFVRLLLPLGVDGIEEEEEDARCCSKFFVGELLLSPNNSSSYPNDFVVAPSLGENPPLAFPRLLNDAVLLLSSEDRTTLLSLIFPADEAEVVFAEEEEEEEPLIKFSLMFPKKKSNTPPPPPSPTFPSLSLSDIKKPPPVSFLSRPSLCVCVFARARSRERERGRKSCLSPFEEFLNPKHRNKEKRKVFMSEIIAPDTRERSKTPARFFFPRKKEEEEKLARSLARSCVCVRDRF